MRQQRTSSSGRGRVVALLTGLFAVMALAVATPALANFSGAIYTTMADCTTVNGNIYDDKQDVYLNGGPQNSNASGLPANTVFYVKVTEPDGTLLSAVSTPDTITSDGDGNLPCTQLWGLLHKQSDGTQGYDTTTNNGSEYKVWISTERDFPHDDSKTDNFKVVVDEEPPPVPAADNLTVTKTADPTFDRSFTWLIDKDVDNTSLNGLFGTATFNYSVAVTKSAASDSGWKVTGTISVTNPNADPVTGVDVSDDIGNEAADTCVVTGGSNATIQAQSTSQFEYTCTYSAAPAAAAQTNTATATWPSQDLAHSTALAGSSATFDAGFTFDNGDMGNPNLSDNCITITDANAPAGTFPPSTCASDSYNYSHAFAVPASGCQSHPNTASFVADTTGATGSDTVTVSVCRVAPNTGALTIGFWQNKNGQAIITGGTATAGVCDAGTWLRAYAPFADLTLGSNCAKVATYVFNVIKAAACTSTSKTCNSMLKAQMLATALNVYFSDPALGGNKIGAAVPLGGVHIDLATVCVNIAACTVFENTSSAFGGVNSLTVGAMLAYAASQSNSGGTAWYGQVKATQVLAKDAFDAINNRVAFQAS